MDKQYLRYLSEQHSEKNLHNEIIKWFMKNPYPDDDQVHDFAESLGMEPDDFEGHIYHVLCSILCEGKSKDFKGTYNPEELKMGVKVEMEHTKIPLLAYKIAKDHLAEIPDYYSRLKKMEGEANVVHEIFIQTGEVEAMPSGEDKDKAILRLSMIAELDAVNLYQRFASISSNKDVEKVLLDIANEEIVHAGEFESVLQDIDPSHEKFKDEGEEEVEDLT